MGACLFLLITESLGLSGLGHIGRAQEIFAASGLNALVNELEREPRSPCQHTWAESQLCAFLTGCVGASPPLLHIRAWSCVSGTLTSSLRGSSRSGTKPVPPSLVATGNFILRLEGWFILELVGPPWAEVLGPGWQSLQLSGACGAGALAPRHRALRQEVWT